jgi:hypothetical protein
MKLKIALNLKAELVLEILASANFKLGMHVLSAFFRKPGHKHFRECKDQVLRNFLQGLAVKHRNISNENKDGKTAPKQVKQVKEQPEKTTTEAPVNSFYKKKLDPK